MPGGNEKTSAVLTASYDDQKERDKMSDLATRRWAQCAKQEGKLEAIQLAQPCMSAGWARLTSPCLQTIRKHQSPR